MSSPDLVPVSFHISGEEAHGRFVVAYENGMNAIIDMKPQQGSASTLTNRWKAWKKRRIAKHSELGDVAIALSRSRPLAAYMLPQSNISTHYSQWFLLKFALLTTLAAVAAVAGTILIPESFFAALVLFIFSVAGAWFRLWQGAHVVETDGAPLLVEDPRRSFG